MKQNPKNKSDIVIEKTKRPDAEKWLIPVASVGSCILLSIALPNLIEVSGIMGALKIAALATTTGIISYSVNKFAIEKGTKYFARGYTGAGIASIISMTLIGAALFGATYAGLTINGTEKLRLQEHGIAYSQFIGERSLKAAEAARTLPIIRSISQDLEEKAACEKKNSCVSGRGNGGVGTFSKILQVQAGSAKNIAVQLETGEETRQKSISNLNQLLDDYQNNLGNPDIDIDKKRRQAEKISAKMNQEISILDEALPTIFLGAYADNLKKGIDVPNRPLATQHINRLLNKNGQSLAVVLESIEKGDQKRPIFPTEAGVGDTFTYLGHFAPISLLTFIIELVWPISLWIYTLIGLKWVNHLEIIRIERDAAVLRSNNVRKINSPRGGK
ncbi:MAG: hypothetical protein OCD03_09430 [Hyphomicrobiales bacterium]